MSFPIPHLDRWIRRFGHHPDAGLRLVCFPHAGGSASYFFPVARALSDRFDVVALQYPGRQDRRQEPCLTSVADLADQIAAALRADDSDDRPTAYFGHSLGATLAYEVAQRRWQDGRPPTVLFASGRRAPSCFRPHQFVHLGDDETLLANLRAMSGTAAALLADRDLLAAILPAVRADYRAAETYRPPVGHLPLPLPVVSLNGTADPEVTAAEVAAWESCTAVTHEQRWFDGDHFYLNEHADQVLEVVRHWCERVVQPV